MNRGELDDVQWRRLIDILESWPRIKELLTEHEHKQWLVRFTGHLAKWAIAVSGAIIAIQQLLIFVKSFLS